MAVAGRTATGGFFQAAAAPPADPERGQQLLHIRALAGLAPDVALLSDTDERLEAASAATAEIFIDRHRVSILPRND